MEPLRLMAVHAHPDDESSKGAATTAKYVAEGHRVLVVSCTGGERGDVLNPALKDDPHILRDLAQVRRDEMARAVAILGCEHTWLGFVDSGLPEGDPRPPLPVGCFALEPLDTPTEALVREIRRFRPHVVTTYDENGGYPHPDHIMTNRVSVEAFLAAGDPDRYPHAGEPWQPLKLYYNGGFHKERLETYHRALLDRGLESPFEDWLKRWEDRPERRISTRIPASEYFDVRDDALRAHATQVDPNGSFFAVTNDIQAEVWPTDDFELAMSYVVTDDDEDDLFAGIDPARADELATSRPELLRDDRVEPTVKDWR